jgi:hypothetical protein
VIKIERSVVCHCSVEQLSRCLPILLPDNGNIQLPKRRVVFERSRILTLVMYSQNYSDLTLDLLSVTDCNVPNNNNIFYDQPLLMQSLPEVSFSVLLIEQTFDTKTNIFPW